MAEDPARMLKKSGRQHGAVRLIAADHSVRLFRRGQ